MRSILRVYTIFGRDFQIFRLVKGAKLYHKAPVYEIDGELRFGENRILRLWPFRIGIGKITWMGRFENEDEAEYAALRANLGKPVDLDALSEHIRHRTGAGGKAFTNR